MTATMPDVDVTPELEQAIREAVQAVRPCEITDPTGHRCDRPASWRFIPLCGCEVLVCNECRGMVRAARIAAAVLCHVAGRTCTSCGRCRGPGCFGLDRWEPLS